MSLSIKGLSKTYATREGAKNVLSGLDLEVRPGELFGLMGSNGSGKTTLLKIISSLVLPSAGEVAVLGVNIKAYPARTKTNIGLIGDAEGGFYQMLSAEENISFFAELFGVGGKLASERMARLFDLFEIKGYKKEKFSHLSSGTRQKLAFVRALMHTPGLLLIDEAVRSLDDASAARVSKYLSEEFTGHGKTCLAVTHDRAWAEKYCKRIGLLKDGNIEIKQ